MTALLLVGLVVARALVVGHPPAAADAFFAAGFAALAAAAFFLDRELVLPAPFGSAALLTGALASSLLTSWHPAITALALPSALGAIAALLAVCAVGASGRSAALVGVGLAGALSSTVAAVQAFVTWPDALARAAELGLSEEQISRLASGRPVGLSLSPDLMGSLALAGCIASLSLFKSSRSLPLRVFAGALLLAAAAGVLLSRSAGVGLAAGVVVGVWALITVVRGMRGPLAALVVATSAVVPLGSVLLFGRGLQSRSSSAHERLLNWQVGLDVLLQHPLQGVGFGRFAAAYASHRMPEANVTRYAHSAPVELAVELGALAGGLVVVVIGAALLVLLRSRLMGRPDASKDVVLAGLYALTLRSCFDYDLSVGANAAVLGVLFGTAWLDVPRGGAVMSAQALPGLARRRTLIALPLLAFLVVGSLLAGAGGLVREGVLSPFRYGAQPRPDDVTALLRYAELVGSDSHALAVQAQLRGRELAACRQDCRELEEAAALLTRELPPHAPPEAWLLSAQLAMRRGERPAVEAAFARALEEDPGAPRTHQLRLAWAREVTHPRLPSFEREARRWGVELK